jgi:hypothetical protein
VADAFLVFRFPFLSACSTASKSQTLNAAHINFAGALIGNGCINWTVQTPESFVDFQLAHNLIPAGPVPPAFNNDTNAWMDAYIGYTPNFYDYRLQNLDCVGCYGFVCRALRCLSFCFVLHHITLQLEYVFLMLSVPVCLRRLSFLLFLPLCFHRCQLQLLGVGRVVSARRRKAGAQRLRRRGHGRL